MATEVILPRVDMDMTTGKISRWYVESGAKVEKGQPLFEIETDKAAMEIDAPTSGTLGNVTAAEGIELPVGSVVAWIYADGEDHVRSRGSSPAPVTRQAEAKPRALEPGSAAVTVHHVPESGIGLRATPLARRLARERGIDLSTVKGSGPRGRIQSADVMTLEIAPDSCSRGIPTPTSGGGILNRAWLRRGGGTPVVLIHGFGADLNGWRPFLSAIPSGRPVLALDLPGHGKSPLPGTISFDAFVAAVADTLLAENVTTLDLVGHSLGAAAATAIGSSGAFDVRSVLLLSPAGLGPDINGAFVSGFARARKAESLAPWMRELVVDQSIIGSAFVKATARARADGALAEAQERIASGLFPDGTQSFSVRALLQNIPAPVKIVFGVDDRIIPARHAFGLPGRVAIHLFPGVGHMPHFEIRDDLAWIIAHDLKW